MQRSLLKAGVVLLFLVAVCTLAGCRTMKYLAAALEISRAERYYAKGKAAETVEHIEKAVVLDPKGPWGELASYRLGEIYLESGYPQKALEVFKQSIKEHTAHLQNRRWEVQLNIGECYERLNDPMEALEHYRGLIENSPDRSGRIKQRIERVENRLDRTGKRQVIEQAYHDYKKAYRQYINVVGGQIFMRNYLLLELALRTWKDSYRNYKLLTEEMSRRELLDDLRVEAGEAHQNYLEAIEGLSPEEYNRPDIELLRRNWEEKQRAFEDIKRELEE